MLESNPEQKSADVLKAEVTAYAHDMPNRDSQRFLLSRLKQVAEDESKPIYRTVDPYESFTLDPNDPLSILDALTPPAENEAETITEVFNPRKFGQFLNSETGKNQTKEYIDLVNNYDQFREVLAPYRDQIDNAPTIAARSVEITDPNTGNLLLATSTRLEDNDWSAGTTEHYVADSVTAQFISSAIKAADIPGVANIVAASYTDAVIISERPAGTEVRDLEVEDVDSITIPQIENYLLTLKALEEADLMPSIGNDISYYDRTEGISIQFVEPKDDTTPLRDKSPMSKALAPSLFNVITKAGGGTVSYEEAKANPELKRPFILARKRLLDRYVKAVTNILSDNPEVLEEIASTIEHEKYMIQFSLDRIDTAEK